MTEASLKTNFHLCKTFSLVTAISDHDLDNIWVEFVDFSSLSIVSKSSLSMLVLNDQGIDSLLQEISSDMNVIILFPFQYYDHSNIMTSIMVERWSKSKL